MIAEIGSQTWGYVKPVLVNSNTLAIAGGTSMVWRGITGIKKERQLTSDQDRDYVTPLLETSVGVIVIAGSVANLLGIFGRTVVPNDTVRQVVVVDPNTHCFPETVEEMFARAFSELPPPSTGRFEWIKGWLPV